MTGWWLMMLLFGFSNEPYVVWQRPKLEIPVERVEEVSTKMQIDRDLFTNSRVNARSAARSARSSAR